MTERHAEHAGADIVALQPRRTYLDECRARGIHSANLEMEAEIASLTVQIAATKRKTDRLNGVPDDNPPIALATYRPESAAFAAALAQREDEVVLRFKTICQQYAGAGCGD